MADAPMIDGESVSDVAAAQPPESTPVEVGYCLQCGYDMRGLGVEVCPECGTRFDAEVTRKHNEQWCRELVRQMRVAHLVTAVGCAHAVHHLLTGGSELPLLAIVGFLGLALAVLYTLAWLTTSLYAPAGQRGKSFARRCGRGVAVAAVVLVGIPVVVVSGWFGVILTLSAGLLLNGIQAQHYVEGKRMGRGFGVSSALTESVAFGMGVSKFFGAVAVILLVAVLAVR